jgi:hypothetical protein
MNASRTSIPLRVDPDAINRAAVDNLARSALAIKLHAYDRTRGHPTAPVAVASASAPPGSAATGTSQRDQRPMRPSGFRPAAG